MTPEERARLLWQKEHVIKRDMVYYVAQAIRQAENDALERAAQRITTGYSWAMDVSAETAEECAKAIRALKTGVAE